MFVLVAQLLAGGDTLSARTETLLAHGNLPEARRIAEQLVAHRPRDPQAHLLLGRVWMRWPTFGRYNAYEEFRAAGFLTPDDPEPQYWKARVGMYLKSDEGEVIAREAILKLLALRADYRDAWTVFESVYHDASDAIWGQLWMIATPEEAARFDSLRLEERRGFFEAFWSRRDPDLLTPANERLGEHYQRLAEVRRMFHLLHPWVGFQHSPYARALAQSYLDDSIQNLLSSAGLDGLDPATNTMPDLHAWNETRDTLTTYALTNLSACGLMWLRHGRPNVWETPENAPIACAGNWTYYTPAGPLSIHFMGIPGALGGHGDAIIAPPTTARGARQTLTLLTTDNTKIPAPLVAHAWSATFLSDQIGFTDVYFKAHPERAAVALWALPTGAPAGRVGGGGGLVLTVAPGAYLLGLDVDSAGVLGRARDEARVPAFSDAVLALSSLVLVPADSVGDREEMLAAMPADLVYPGGRPLAAYAEIYGFRGGAGGPARYRVEYTFAPLRGLPQRLLGGGHEVRLAFTREGPVRGAVPRRPPLRTRRPPPGRYRVSIAVTDLATDVKTTAVALDIAVR